MQVYIGAFVRCKNKGLGEEWIKKAFSDDSLLVDHLTPIDGSPVPPGEIWLLTNDASSGFYRDFDDPQALVFDDMDPKGDMGRFWRIHGEHLLTLQGLFGAENVAVDWGVINYDD